MEDRQKHQVTLPVRLLRFALVTGFLPISLVALAAAQTGAPGPVAGTGIAAHSSAPGGSVSHMGSGRRAPSHLAPGNNGIGRANPAHSSYGRPSTFGNTADIFSNPGAFSTQPGYIAPPRPSFELPRDPHPTFEVPRYSGVQPYLQNNSNSRQNFGALPYYGGYFPGYIDPGYTGSFDQYGSGYDQNGGYGDEQQNGPSPSGQYADQSRPPYNGPYGQRPAPPEGYPNRYQRPPAEEQTSANPGPITNGLDHPEVTLIFNNNRPEEQVKNYAVTSTTLFILDGTKRRQIPISELDIPKTVEKNQENGIEFTVPGHH